MKRPGFGAAHWQRFGGLLLTFLATVSVAQVQPQALRITVPAADAAQAGLDQVHDQLRVDLGLSSGHSADGELQSAAKAMVEGQLPRMRALLSIWLDEERQLAPEDALGWQLQAVSLRVQNELALWRLDSAGPEHARRWQLALARPQACQIAARRPTLMDELVQVWQQVPLAQRPAHLRDEAELLARWGLPRPQAPQRPLQSVDELAWRDIDDYAATQKPLPRALPPILSWRLFNATPDASTRRQSDSLCALRQWSLALSLDDGKAELSPQQWLAQRYARMPQRVAESGPGDAPGSAGDSYPELARRLRVEGEITVEYQVDPQGQWLGGSVVRREVRVPGIRLQRPVAFETLLDAASIARTAAMPPRPPETTQDGRAVRSVEFKYKLQ